MRAVVLFILTALAAVALLLLAGTDRSSAPPANGKLQVVTTLLPIYCFAAKVAGDAADVENLLPAGAGPHDFQFKPSHVGRLSDADLVIINGVGLEPWMERAVQTSGQLSSRQVVEAAEGLDEQLIRRSSESETGGEEVQHAGADYANPHFWLDPTLAAAAVENIIQALEKADPVNAEVYAGNGEDYLQRLDALDRELEDGLEPVRDVPFVTFHDAFPYLVRRYELKLIGVIEPRADVQPSLKYLKKLVDRIRGEDVKAIFAEPQLPQRLARQLSADLGVPVGELDPLETGSLEPGTYEAGMRENLRVLRKYLLR